MEIDCNKKPATDMENHLVASTDSEKKQVPEEFFGFRPNEKRKERENEGRYFSNKRKQKGMNKNRGPTFRVERENELCPHLVNRQKEDDPKCTMDKCKFIHDLTQYLENKLPSLGDECYVFNTRGHCPRGLTCRFGSKHVSEGGLNIVNEARYSEWQLNTKLHTTNGLKYDIQNQLRKRTYNFDKSEKILSKLSKESQAKKNNTSESVGCESSGTAVKSELESVQVKSDVSEVCDTESKLETSKFVCGDGDSLTVVNGNSDVQVRVGPVLDSDIIRLQEGEKKKIDWREKLFLSPLTTVGNLPFRRICKEFGADVTCGEMALAVNILQGKPQEWALTKRHGSEEIFGVQVCGSNANVMTRCAQLIQEQTDVDFIDINVGCPIDLIYQQGAGSGLLNKKKVLFSIVKSMKSVLDIPLTVKTRIGVYSGKPVAHTLMKDFTDSGADLITIHGRSKEQRYTKLADWEYVEQCAQLAAPTPVVGNGDILSYEDYDLAREKSPTSASIMIGRGALFKPWIFTELKERRHWDISSQERFEILKRYTNYGFEHWGSDTKGVETTRRFLLEWLSFLCRYMPVGLMENPPQKMNVRVPKFEARDELETLMASCNSADWIKISEMLLGPVPDGFQFVPKHKANAWS